MGVVEGVLRMYCMSRESIFILFCFLKSTGFNSNIEKGWKQEFPVRKLTSYKTYSLSLIISVLAYALCHRQNYTNWKFARASTRLSGLAGVIRASFCCLETMLCCSGSKAVFPLHVINTCICKDPLISCEWARVSWYSSLSAITHMQPFRPVRMEGKVTSSLYPRYSDALEIKNSCRLSSL